MATSQSTVSTKNGVSYLRRLCKHWSHKFETELQESSGRVHFGEGKLIEFSADAEALAITITADPEAFDKLEDVIVSHLERFAAKETLQFTWTRTEEVQSR